MQSYVAEDSLCSAVMLSSLHNSTETERNPPPLPPTLPEDGVWMPMWRGYYYDDYDYDCGYYYYHYDEYFFGRDNKPFA